MFKIFRRLVRPIKSFWVRFRHQYLLLWAQRDVSRRWKNRLNGRGHKLPSQLIVSLTSYPARFATLPLTLKCLLAQTVQPDRVILWIAHEDKHALTDGILNLQNDGLEIKFCENLRSYKKIIPTLQMAPEAFIVTADDDLYYWPTWLEELSEAYSGNDHEVLCHRAHLIQLNETGMPLPYLSWVFETEYKQATPLIFPTGCGGVMYPPNVFHADVLDSGKFMSHCPLADDVWLYWMVRLAGGKSRKIGKRQRLIDWPGTQESALWLTNVSDGHNDEQIKSLINIYGYPR